jgi:hypothetical protein
MFDRINNKIVFIKYGSKYFCPNGNIFYNNSTKEIVFGFNNTAKNIGVDVNIFEYTLKNYDYKTNIIFLLSIGDDLINCKIYHIEYENGNIVLHLF